VWRLIVWLAKATGMPHWMFEVALPEQIGMRRYTRIDGRGQPVTLLVPFERRQETGS
jgi:hypothetical protein